jgi:hypothetical protein
VADAPSKTGRWGRPRTITIAGLIAVVAVVGGLIIYHSLTDSYTMNGTLTLAGAQATRTDNTDGCTGGWLRPGIKPGATVTVYDSAGKVVGLSILRSGAVTSDLDCVFPFTVADVPTGQDFYLIEVANTGKVTFAGDQAEAPALSLGK